eukprot:scaffold468821_cov25-Prasinocladus_malaysianus.AAC.1
MLNCFSKCKLFIARVLISYSFSLRFLVAHSKLVRCKPNKQRVSCRKLYQNDCSVVLVLVQYEFHNLNDTPRVP